MRGRERCGGPDPSDGSDRQRSCCYANTEKAGLAQARQFSWQKTAQQTIAAYERADALGNLKNLNTTV